MVRTSRFVPGRRKDWTEERSVRRGGAGTLHGLAETASGEWVFPGKEADGPLGESNLYGFWRRMRDAAGIVADARLYDLRHAHASHAVMNGESLHVGGRLLGHSRAPVRPTTTFILMTLR